MEKSSWNTRVEPPTVVDNQGDETVVDRAYIAFQSENEKKQVEVAEKPTVFSGPRVVSSEGEDDTQGDNEVPKDGRSIPSIKRLFTGEVVAISKSVFCIGRKDDEADYVVSHNPAISRKHAEIFVRNDKYYIRDLGAKNRTFVNGKMLPQKAEAPLVNGDIIKLANEDFLLQLER